jgi:N-glycosylase/DNA lyase
LKHGRYTVPHGARGRVLARCDCGVEKIVEMSDLRSGRVKTLHVAEWARRTGLHVQTILWRLQNGRTIDEALALVKNVVRRKIARGNGGKFIRA